MEVSISKGTKNIHNVKKILSVFFIVFLYMKKEGVDET